MTHRYYPCSSPPYLLPYLCFTCLAILILHGSVSNAQEPSDLELEKVALDALVKKYKLDYHKMDPDGYVIDVRLHGKLFDDKALDYAVQFTKLTELSVARSSITDAGFEKLQKFKHLEKLAMGYTAVTDRGLGYLEKIPTLRQI